MNDLNGQPAGADPSGDGGEAPRGPATGAQGGGSARRRPSPPRPGRWFDPPEPDTPEPDTPEPEASASHDADGGADGDGASRPPERVTAGSPAEPARGEPAAAAGDGAATEELPAVGDEPKAAQRERPAPEPAPEEPSWAEPPSGLDAFWPGASSPPPPAGKGPGLPRTGPPGGSGGPPEPGRGRPAVLIAGAFGLVVMLLLAVAGIMVLRGDGDKLRSLADAVSGRRDAQTSSTTMPPAQVVVAPADGQKKVRPDSPIRVIASGGRLTSVSVTAKGGKKVAGKLAQDGSSWESSGRMVPATRYTVTAKAENPSGKASTTKTTFTTLTPADELGTSIMPLDGETVGVGMPIGVFFSAPVTDKAAVERQLQVSSSHKVEGAWRWFGDRQVRWRPKEFWPAGEKVTLRVKLTGIDAGKGVWGMADRVIRFTVGDSHVSTVDVTNHTMTVAVNGKNVRTLPVSTGRQKYPTTNGIHTVLEKNRHKIMDSATIGIPKGSPDYYRTQVEFAVRITNTGEFIHSAPWSEGAQGSQNVSHGCVNVSMENGAWFFGMARRGDVVKVIGSPRQPGETEGLLEWNRTFDAWKEGSAL